MLPAGAWLNDPRTEPSVSVVIPMYNEKRYIANCIDSVLNQDYPLDKLEIHVVDSSSTDGSEAVVRERYLAAGAPVLLHKNTQRKTSQSLNIGLKAATGDIIIILGAHAEMEPGFIRYNVENLRRTDVHCSGGTVKNVGQTVLQNSIGAAMSHPFATAAAYRFQRRSGPQKTVVYGAYRREVFTKVGAFEEAGAVPDDAELNCRLLQAGLQIYYDPRIVSRYHPRSTFRALALQMFGYGYFRNQMFRKHYQSSSISWFHLVPPVSLVLFAGLALAAGFYPPVRPGLTALAALYGLLLILFSVQASLRQRQGNPLLIAGAFVTTHVAWGLGFMRGLLQSRTRFTEYVN